MTIAKTAHKPAHKMASAPLQMHAVKSNSIHSLGHDGETMTIKFVNGNRYTYSGVSATEFAQLRNAESVGKHFHAKFGKIKGKLVKE